MDGITPNHCRLSRNNIMDSTYASLERLQLDYVDILYFHSFDPITPIEESLETIDDLVKRDLIRYFAVSNFTVDQLKSYQLIEEKLSIRTQTLAVQNQFDILNGEGNEYAGVLELAARTGVSFVAWSPLARGVLSDRYLDLSKVKKGDRLFDEGTLENVINKEVLAKLNRLADLAKQWDMTIAQLSLAYMLTLPGMGPVIPSSSTVEQLEQNAAAGKIELTDEQKTKIEQVLS